MKALEWSQHFPHYNPMGAIHCHGHQSSDPIWPKTYCSLSPYPMMVQLKFCSIDPLVAEIFKFENVHKFENVLRRGEWLNFELSKREKLFGWSSPVTELIIF